MLSALIVGGFMFLLLYKRDVNPAGTVWVPAALRTPWRPPQAQPVVTEHAVPPADPMDLNDVFRRRA
jgi:hypothetical protein